MVRLLLLASALALTSPAAATPSLGDVWGAFTSPLDAWKESRAAKDVATTITEALLSGDAMKAQLDKLPTADRQTIHDALSDFFSALIRDRYTAIDAGKVAGRWDLGLDASFDRVKGDGPVCYDVRAALELQELFSRRGPDATTGPVLARSSAAGRACSDGSFIPAPAPK